MFVFMICDFGCCACKHQQESEKSEPGMGDSFGTWDFLLQQTRVAHVVCKELKHRNRVEQICEEQRSDFKLKEANLCLEMPDVQIKQTIR
jgi:hypothetical protein